MEFGSDKKENKAVMDRISAIAMGEAIKYSVGTAVAVGGLTAGASLYNKNFNRFMSISAKTSLPIMASLGIFSFKYEMVQHDAIRNPERWGLKEYASTGKFSRMPAHHQILNFIYDRPFHMVAGLGMPLAGVLLYKNLQLTHLTLSQKIMHTRVYAQAGVLTILLLTMAFRGFMDKHGRFPEPDQITEDAQTLK